MKSFHVQSYYIADLDWNWNTLASFDTRIEADISLRNCMERARRERKLHGENQFDGTRAHSWRLIQVIYEAQQVA